MSRRGLEKPTQIFKFSQPGYDPATLVNRPMRIRLWGGVGAGGEPPPATRLSFSFILICCW